MHQARRVEELHEPLIGFPRLRRREMQVLVEDRRQAPPLQLPQAPYYTAGPVLKNTENDNYQGLSNFVTILNAMPAE
jgi:hypothetical protein